jgi:phenylpropionate dioxygenase-like ring-hydroxylating dioxygenase large terminal subunit
MDHRCPHRCASLFLGRNEQNGLRCVYHGWKFDVAGNCVDMPSVPAHQDFKEKVKAKAYPAMERAGVVWVYMGGAAKAPPLPELETLVVPDEEIGVSFVMRSCNYLQALEGDIDTSHFGFLHAGHVDPNDVPEDHPIRHTVTVRAPLYNVSDTPWGTTYAAYRDAGAGQTYWRFANFLMPFWTQQPQGEFGEHVHNIHLQDQAVTESMGAITDHAFEHLGPSDQMIARTRRRLLRAARALRDEGTPPPGIEDPGAFRGARSGYFISGETRSWQEIYARQFSIAVRPAEALRTV